jgi:hypothetical protein
MSDRDRLERLIGIAGMLRRPFVAPTLRRDGAENAVDNGAISLLARTDSPNVGVGAARSPATLVAGVSSVPSNRAASPISHHRKRQDRSAAM